MRKSLLVLALLAVTSTACADTTTPIGSDPTTTTGAPVSAEDCATTNAGALESGGVLTVGTGNPAFPPWW